MKSYAKPIAKQLVIAALVLILVTVASLGIRQVRFNLQRSNTIESPVMTDLDLEPKPADPLQIDTDPDSQYAYASDSDIEDEPEPQPPAVSVSGTRKPPKAKSFKDKKTKSKGSKDLEKISLSENENLYRTKTGELWYVSKQPDGKTVKMQVHIDDATGEIALIDAKSGGSQNLQKISLGDYDNLYITESGEQWYVSEHPDGSSSKSRVQIDDTGEVTVLEDYSSSDNGQDGAGKDSS